MIVNSRGLHAVVVVAAGAQAARLSAVADERAMLARDALADFVHGDVAGAGVIRFVAQARDRAQWDARRFRESSGIRWLGISIRSFLPGLTGGRAQMLDHLFADAHRIFFEIHFRHVFPTGGCLRRRSSCG